MVENHRRVVKNFFAETTGKCQIRVEANTTIDTGSFFFGTLSLKNAEESSYSPDEYTAIVDIPRKNPTEQFDFNYQPLANQIKSHWVSTEYDRKLYYKETHQYGFLRDEQYAFFIRWIYNTGEKSKSFPAHGDNTENFLFHTEGKTKWTIYKEFLPSKEKTILQEFILTPGDLLYIPSYQYHKVDALEPRILISIHFKNKKEQSLNKFKITTIEESGRDKWYDLSPPKQKINKPTPARRMNKARWSKPYFNKL